MDLGNPPVFLYGRPFLANNNKQDMTTTTLQLLKDGESIFNRIAEFEASPDSLDDVLEMIDKYEPPASWILELPSQLKEGTYKTIPLELMEAAAKRIFGQGSCIGTISSPTIIQDKMGKFSVSVTAEYVLCKEYGYYSVVGIASVTSPNLQGLELATPKASSMAVKNALKQLGGLFGKYLNKVEDQEISEAPKENLEDRLESLPETLKSIKTLEELKTFRKLVYSRSVSHEIQTIYEEKFRELKSDNQKNN
jgi:uncharacterized protein YaaR (DUF327 family)